MKSVLYTHVFELYKSLGLNLSTRQDVDYSIRVDNKFSIGLIEIPFEHLVLCSTINTISSDQLLEVMQQNLINEYAFPYVLALNEMGKIVIWQRLSTDALNQKPLVSWFEEFVKFVEYIDNKNFHLANKEKNQDNKNVWRKSMA